jgi:hypothetical protein
VFCGSDGPLTREHVIPQWISQLLPWNREIIHKVEKAEWSAPIFGHTVSVVCATCNNGWMSRLETAVKHFLGPAIFTPAAGALVSPITQVNVATWAVKTMLMADHAAGTGQLVFPAIDYKRIATVRQPPRMARVSLAQLDFHANLVDPVAGYHGRTARWAVDDADDADGYVAALQIGHLGAVVAYIVDREGVNLPSPAMGTAFENSFVEAWPPHRLTMWPPAAPSVPPKFVTERTPLMW